MAITKALAFAYAVLVAVLIMAILALVRIGTLNTKVQSLGDSIAAARNGVPIPIPKVEDWKPLTTFGPGWGPGSSTSATPQYRIDLNGVVHLRGMVNRSAGVGTIVATLPEGYRPANIKAGDITGVVNLGSSASGIGEIRINSVG